eukprot:g7407.t1
MGRARFIDACEAQLSKREIKKIEYVASVNILSSIIVSLRADIGKYLYVLFPKDGEMTEEMKEWQGKVKTIEERLGRMLKIAQKEILDSVKSNMNAMEKTTQEVKQMKEGMERIQEIAKEMEKDINEEVKTLKEDITQIKHMKNDINEIKSMKEDMKKMSNTLQLVMEKVSTL